MTKPQEVKFEKQVIKTFKNQGSTRVVERGKQKKDALRSMTSFLLPRKQSMIRRGTIAMLRQMDPYMEAIS